MTDLNANGPTPQLWGKLVLARLKNSSDVLEFLKMRNKIVSSRRFLMPRGYTYFSVTNSVTEYDAYDRDIAILNVYFETPTVLEYTTQHSKTWLDFISAVGGNGGLFIGFSIVTIIEIVWLLFQALSMYLTP
jgi:hypothetical protein